MATKKGEEKASFDWRNATTADKLREHANVMFTKIPASEQYIGARDTVLHTVLHELAAWMDSVDKRLRP